MELRPVDSDARARGRFEYVAALDGVRGVAVAAVLLFHLPVSWMQGGFLGVSTFFTLSGFLITSLLLREQRETGSIDLKGFWIRRARRLLPAAAVTIAGVAVASRWSLDSSQLVRARGDLLATIFYGANWRFITSGQAYTDLFVAPSPVLHFWSLAIEEQFYLLYPLLTYGVLRLAGWSCSTFGVLLAGLCAASILGPSLYGFSRERIYYGTDARAAELLIGGVLAVILATPRVVDRVRGDVRLQWALGLGGTVALLVSIGCWVTLTQGTDVLYAGGFGAYAVVSALLVAGALVPARRSPVSAVLSLPPLRGLGRISYGVYLYHWPIYLWVSPDRTGLTTGWLAVMRIVLTVGLAWLSFNFLELPIRQGQIVRDRRVLPAVPAVALGLALVAFVAVPVSPPDGGSVAFAAEDTPPPVVSSDDLGLPSAVETPVRVLVVGEIANAPLVDQLVEWARSNAPSLELRSALAECGRTRAEIGVEFRTDQMTCAGWVQVWGPQLREVEPDLVVVLQPLVHTTLPAWGDRVFREEADAVVELLSSRGARLVPVLVPGGQRDGFNEMILREADAQGVNAGAIDRFGPEGVVATIGERLLVLGEPGRRPQSGGSARIMVVGDSVASNLGRALEQWGSRTGRATVWNAAALGCGLAAGGITNADPPHNKDTKKCIDWRSSWREKVDEFRPDIVVVINSAWDLPDRRLPNWPDQKKIGDPIFDEWLVSQYQGAADIFASRGASVVWATLPCTGTVWAGFAISRTGAFDNQRIRALNEQILPRVRGINLVDLDGFVCPGGRFDPNLGGIDGARPDGLHFADDAARYVAEWLGPKVLEHLHPDR
ncbi:MAG: acyltransferase [Acidimicrobiales bacterium]|nr:acyltransferase [Acidimicrobiales bacterium]